MASLLSSEYDSATSMEVIKRPLEEPLALTM
jgi:hypothetical protein